MKLRNLKTVFFFVLIIVFTISCKKEPKDNTLVKDGEALTFSMIPAISHMPLGGENATSVALSNSGKTAANFGTQLYVGNINNDTWTLLDNTRQYYDLKFISSDLLLAVTSNNIVLINSNNQISEVSSATKYARIYTGNNGVYVMPNSVYQYCGEFYFSSDNCSTWDTISLPSTIPYCFALGVTQSGMLIIHGNNFKIASSTNNGKTWDTYSSEIATALDGTEFFESHTGRIFAYFIASTSSFYYSDDNCASFKPIAS